MDIPFSQEEFVKEIKDLSTPNNSPSNAQSDSIEVNNVDLNSTTQSETKPQSTESKAGKAKQKVAKQVYIDKIVQLELQSGKVKKEDLEAFKKRLRRKTIAELEEILAEDTKEITIALQKVEIEQTQSELKEAKSEADGKQPESAYQMPSERMIDLLFSINVVAAKSVEELSVLGKKHYPDIIKADCVGYSDILVKENQVALKEALKGVVADHREILDRYMTPFMVLLVINYLSVNQAFIKNLQKKETS